MESGKEPLCVIKLKQDIYLQNIKWLQWARVILKYCSVRSRSNYVKLKALRGQKEKVNG